MKRLEIWSQGYCLSVCLTAYCAYVDMSVLLARTYHNGLLMHSKQWICLLTEYLTHAAHVQQAKPPPNLPHPRAIPCPESLMRRKETRYISYILFVTNPKPTSCTDCRSRRQSGASRASCASSSVLCTAKSGGKMSCFTLKPWSRTELMSCCSATTLAHRSGCRHCIVILSV